jgi:hypothetical protein
MKQSESIKNLAIALAKVQAELQPAELNAKNPFFKSDYADLGSVVKAARSLMAENGLSISQFPGDTKPGDSLRAELTSILMHASGEWLQQTMSLPLAKSDPQGYGSALTYMRRYAYASIVGIVTGDDDDGNIASGKTNGQPATKQPPPTKKDIKPPMPTDTMRKKFHAVGTQRHGDAWDDNRPLIVKAITGKREDGTVSTSSNDLTRAEMQWAIDQMVDKMAAEEAAKETS